MRSWKGSWRGSFRGRGVPVVPFSLSLETLPAEVFVYFVVFARIGSAMMFLPAFGEPAINARVRLMLALAVTVVSVPVVRGGVGPVPDKTLLVFIVLIKEILIGLALGALARMMMSALQVAGTVIAMSTGLGAAQTFDPTQGTQSAIFGTFLSITAVTLIFVTDLHHLLLAALVDSYTVFPPGNSLSTEVMAGRAVEMASHSFMLGLRLAAPFVVFSIIFYTSLGVLSRLMPQIQVFFIAMPANILIGFTILMLTVSGISMLFLSHFQTVISGLFGQ